MGKSVHLFAAMVVALLTSVGALVALPVGHAQGAAIEARRHARYVSQHLD